MNKANFTNMINYSTDERGLSVGQAYRGFFDIWQWNNGQNKCMCLVDEDFIASASEKEIRQYITTRIRMTQQIEAQFDELAFKSYIDTLQITELLVEYRIQNEKRAQQPEPESSAATLPMEMIKSRLYIMRKER